MEERGLQVAAEDVGARAGGHDQVERDVARRWHVRLVAGEAIAVEQRDQLGVAGEWDLAAALRIGRREDGHPASRPAEHGARPLHPWLSLGGRLVILRPHRAQLPHAERLRRRAAHALVAAGRGERIGDAVGERGRRRAEPADRVGGDIARGAAADAIRDAEHIAGIGNLAEDAVAEAQRVAGVAVVVVDGVAVACARDAGQAHGLHRHRLLEGVGREQRAAPPPRHRRGARLDWLFLEQDVRQRRHAGVLVDEPAERRIGEGMPVLGAWCRWGAVGAIAAGRQRHRRRPGRRRLDGERLRVAAPVGGGHDVADHARAGEVVVGGQRVRWLPDDARHRRRAGVRRRRQHEWIGRFLDGHDVDQRPPGRARRRRRRIDQQRLPGRQAQAVAEHPHLACACPQAALAVVPPVRRDLAAVAARIDRVRGNVQRARRGIDEPGAGLELDGDAVGALCGDEQARRHRGRGLHVELQQYARRRRRPRLVVHQARVTDDRAALGRRLQRRLGGDPVLDVAQIIGDATERLHEYHAEVGLRPLRPFGVAERGEVRQGTPEAREVLGQVVDRRRVGRQRRADDRRRRAIEFGRAAGLEREARVVEERIEDGAHEHECVEREVTGVVHPQREHRSVGGVHRPVAGGDRMRRHARDHVAAGDARGGYRPLQRDGREEVHPKCPLVRGRDLDEVDAV